MQPLGGCFDPDKMQEYACVCQAISVFMHTWIQVSINTEIVSHTIFGEQRKPSLNSHDSWAMPANLQAALEHVLLQPLFPQSFFKTCIRLFAIYPPTTLNSSWMVRACGTSMSAASTASNARDTRDAAAHITHAGGAAHRGAR